MKRFSKDVVIPVLLVCFVYPILAGLWWNYLSGHAEPQAVASTALPK
ncbi:MAG: hypothetical protein RL328_2771 [Acidobacteriota bacterium]|jgi:hypothetical protein